MARTDFLAMGAIASILVSPADVLRLGDERIGRAVAAARRDLEVIDRRFSETDPDSEISRWLSGGSVSPDALADFNHVLRACGRLNEESDGAFSINGAAIGRVDTAGYVKGYGMSRAARTLRALDVTNFVIGVGVDTYFAGLAEDSRPWRAAVSDPGGDVVAILDASDVAIATADISERGVDFWNGHESAQPDLRSFTVIGPDIAEADAYATIGFAMGETGVEWVAERPGYRSVAIRSDGSVLSDAALVSAA